MGAAQKNDTAMLKILLAAGAYANQQDHNQTTAQISTKTTRTVIPHSSLPWEIFICVWQKN